MSSSTEQKTRAGVVRLLCVCVVTLIAMTQIMRPSVRDAAIFAGVAVLLVLGTGRRAPVLPRWSADTGRWVLLPAAVVGLVLIVAPRSNGPDALVLGAVGVVVLVRAWGQGEALDVAIDDLAPDKRPPLRRAALAWSGIVVGLGLWELTAFLLAESAAVDEVPPPSVSDLLDPLLDGAPGRAVFVALWVGAGLFLLRRGRLAAERRPHEPPGTR